ncbi:MAG TPA: tetratricopeptide repeat protein [Pyrinomonadaceae bacterium]|nr:tetratricopeptide repeat protein [Pyrinomonadaceae bacterium]
MNRTTIGLVAAALLFLCAPLVFAQSGATRPRRVTPAQPTPEPTAAAGTTNSTRTAQPASGGTSQTSAAGTTAHALALLNQKQYDAALAEAKQLAAADAKNSEAWKIAGFAEYYLKRYAEAAEDLQRALDLRRASGATDAETEDALARAYFFAQDYERAQPLLAAATSRAGAQPDASMLYYRGLSEFNLKRVADAERSFNAAVKADPKNTGALFYLGRIAFDRKDFNAAINMLNRATTGDPRLVQGWTLLTYSYLQRAATQTGPKADADYLAAVRASESLARLKPDEDSFALQAQALFSSKQYARAAAVLEPVAAKPEAQGTTLYLLGYAHVQAQNFPKAIAALERAAAKTPDNADVYRLLGFSYESAKQYAKALAAYEKGLQLAPSDAYFKESADRVRPVVQRP